MWNAVMASLIPVTASASPGKGSFAGKRGWVAVMQCANQCFSIAWKKAARPAAY